MPKVYKEWIEQHLKSSYISLGSQTCTYDGIQPVDEVTVRLFISNLTLLWAGLVDLSGYEECRCAELLSLFPRWTSEVLSRPLMWYFTTNKKLLLLLRAERPLVEFRDCIKGNSWLLKPVIPFMRSRNDVTHFQVLHHFFSYMSKMGMDRDGLEDEENVAYFSNEEKLLNFRNPSSLPYAEALRSIITTWFRGWDPSQMRHGYFSNGSTADCGKDLLEKIVNNSGITATLAAILPPDDFSCCNWGRKQYFTSKYQYVPKNAEHLRGISMEEAACNYYQSSLDDSLREYISNSELRHHLDFEHQSKSRVLALEGSKTLQLGTADLSAASDSVSLSHVVWLFSGHQELLTWLLATRSKYTQMVGSADGVYELEKFAPMGSRLCFTVESVVFSAFCELAVRLSKRDGNKDCRYQVYGDDIVIASGAFDYLSDILAQWGFTVNREKSYNTGHFREACGTFAYDGADITVPMCGRKSIDIYSMSFNSTEVSSLTHLANREFAYGMYFTRYCIVHQLLADGILPRFIFPTDELIDLLCENDKTSERPVELSPGFVLLSWQPTNWRLRSRKRQPFKVIAHGPKGRYSFVLLQHQTVTQTYESMISMPSTQSDRKYSDEERLVLWLYAAEHNEREKVCRNIFLPFNVPEARLVIPVRPKRRWAQF